MDNTLPGLLRELVADIESARRLQRFVRYLSSDPDLIGYRLAFSGGWLDRAASGEGDGVFVAFVPPTKEVRDVVGVGDAILPGPGKIDLSDIEFGNPETHPRTNGAG